MPPWHTDICCPCRLRQGKEARLSSLMVRTTTTLESSAPLVFSFSLMKLASARVYLGMGGEGEGKREGRRGRGGVNGRMGTTSEVLSGPWLEMCGCP